MKEGQPAIDGESLEEIKAGLSVPVMSQYYSRLNIIDQELSRRFYPINEAMAEALKRSCTIMLIVPGHGSARSARPANHYILPV